jgi:methyl halide transferase
MSATETDWENCYRTNDTHWDKGAPSPGLADWLAAHPDLPTGDVVVPGCGFGHDVREWAKAGHSAVGYDIAAGAVQGATEKTNRTGLPAIFRLGDFLADEPDRQFDWVFEHTFYCAIPPTRRDDHRAAVKRWLKPGGQLLAVHYFIPDKDGPPFGTDRKEIMARFSDDFELVEDWVPRSYPNRTNLERMFWWRMR